MDFTEELRVQLDCFAGRLDVMFQSPSDLFHETLAGLTHLLVSPTLQLSQLVGLINHTPSVFDGFSF